MLFKKKKKIEDLERELRIVRDEFERNKGTLLAYQKNDNNEKIASQMMEENQKLIKWIMNILDTFGTMEVRDKRNVQIPVVREKIISNYNTDYSMPQVKERITIPEITLIKMS